MQQLLFKVCGRNVGASSESYVSPYLQDTFLPFIEGFVLGQRACDTCYNKLYAVLGKRKQEGEHTFARRLFREGLLSRTKYDVWLDASRTRMLAMPLGKVWRETDIRSFNVSTSPVPPLRYVVDVKIVPKSTRDKVI